MFNLGFLGVVLGFGSGLVWAQTCPTGWETKPSAVSECRAKLPSDDYFYLSGANNAFPVCGGTGSNPNDASSARIAVLPNFEPRQISTSSMPNSNKTFVFSANPAATPFQYVKSSEDSLYLYDAFSRCVCHSTTVPSGSSSYDENSVFPGGNFPGTYARVYPDTYEAFMAQDQDATVKYNRVAYSTDLSVNGRSGLAWSGGAAYKSRCGCPNLNETTEPNTTSVTSGIVGRHCVPKISGTTPGRVLMTYNPDIHIGAAANSVTSAMGNIIIDEADEGIDSVIPSKILVPTTSGGTQEYKRKIWTCAPPYRTNSSGSGCVLDSINNHQCDAGSTGYLASPVSSDVSGATMTEKFGNTINKRLACCMNEINSINPSMFLKYDCIDNSVKNYSNFDALWESHEEGLPNAVVMSNALGEYINGFYTLSGSKCDQYSDFGASTYSGYRMKKASNGQWVNGSTTKTINAPSSLVNLMTTKSKTVPSDPASRVRCPILVRVATVMTCPTPTKLPSLQRTFTPPGADQNTRCSSAASVKLHIRIEQLYEIEGMPTMNPVDTVQENRLVSSISVEKIITNKSQGKCPGGATLSGETCVYR